MAIGLFASRAYVNERGAPAAEAYAGHDFILFDESLAGMPGVGWIEDRLAGARVALRSNEILPLLAAARAGAGIAYLPAIAAFDEPDLMPVAPGIIGRPDIFLITHRELRRRARVRVAFDFIVRLCTERAPALQGASVDATRPKSPSAPVSATPPMPAAPSQAPLGS